MLKIPPGEAHNLGLGPWTPFSVPIPIPNLILNPEPVRTDPGPGTPAVKSMTFMYHSDGLLIHSLNQPRTTASAAPASPDSGPLPAHLLMCLR